MNPIYKFQLAAGEDSQQAFPIYNNDLSIEYALEQNQQFYRGKLSGKLMFQSTDFAFIRNKSFDTQFDIEIFISYDAGATWSTYWTGKFWKTDCEFDDDAQTVVVTPTLNDRYNAVLDGLEKEYNLIDLAPAINNIKLDKRPMIQVYVPGQTVIGCFLSGMWWEQECEAESNETTLQTTYYFAKNKGLRIIDVSGTTTPELPSKITGTPPDAASQNYEYNINANYKLTYTWFAITGGVRQTWEIVRRSDSVALWRYQITTTNPYGNPPYTITLSPVASGVSGNVTLSFRKDLSVYARYICDVESYGGVNTYPIPANDIVPDNRNYSRVVPYDAPDTIYIWNYLVSTPTPWGMYQPGQYYANPEDYGTTMIAEAFPVARNSWNDYSIWFAPTLVQMLQEEQWRKEYALSDAFPLWSVISVLLGQIAPGITHQASTNYSQFLYAATNPVTQLTNQLLLITPKSNLINAGYDQPAQKAPITLKMVLEMLRDCFRCYWFIDSNNRFRIEHIRYFQKGGSYTDDPSVGIDLTKQVVTRNGKPWAFARNEYQFDKPEMTARYQFEWMDDVTQYFEGFPIDILSKFVTPDKIENINISKFTSDVDYILLNPNEINKDGFVLLSASLVDGEYKLPYFNYITQKGDSQIDHYLQNGYVAFVYLQRYYLYDLPGPNYSINGVNGVAAGTKKLKTQTIKFPVLVEPDMMNLIKTEIGNGTIQKMSVNLSSRNANTTLKYDTE